MKNDIYLNYDKQAFVHTYPVFVEGDDGKDYYDHTDEQTIAKITTHLTKSVYKDLQEMYEKASIDELLVISAIAKRLANDRINRVKKYL